MPDADYERQLEDAVDLLWGWMPAAQVKEICSDAPALADFCRHVRHKVSHEEAMVRRSSWAPIDVTMPEVRARVRGRMAEEGIPIGTDNPTLLALGATPLLPDAERPPAIPKAALERERAKHPHRSSHFRNTPIDGGGADGDA